MKDAYLNIDEMYIRNGACGCCADYTNVGKGGAIKFLEDRIEHLKKQLEELKK